MVWHYNIADIELGEPIHSGHEVYPDAMYTAPDSNLSAKVIFKKNKYGKQNFSRMEVAFSQLARLFLAKGLTSPQKLVEDDDHHIVGLVTEHLCYIIAAKEGLKKAFYTFDDPRVNCHCTKQMAAQAENIPYYFFDGLPQGFFGELLKAEKNNELTIDYKSLASILASSYTLEEDDLHKGNFGFYLLEKEGKPEVVFFKIDHDLMFADSIMSFSSMRPTQVFLGKDAFEITAEDLLRFPHLINSTNSYWPTKLGYFSNPWDNRKYRSRKEVQAFDLLADLPEFKKAKWMAFYKHILLSPELIELTLRECLDKQKPFERAQISLVSQATVARQARLKATLFSIKEFRDFVAGLTKADHAALINEIRESCNNEQYLAQVEVNQSIHQTLCQSEQGFTEGDTPLHTAIKLGDFRYEETLRMFGQYINTKNKAGKTPLDVAFDFFNKPQNISTDIRKDLPFTMHYLLSNGAELSSKSAQNKLEALLQTHQYHTPYLDLVKKDQTYRQFKAILRDIGEDSSLCLKFKKNFAIECVVQYIKLNQDNPHLKSILIQLKSDFNGESTKAEYAGVQYIRQLRSKLWIIRQIRGLYGTSSSLNELNDLLDNELELIRGKEEGGCFPF